MPSPQYRFDNTPWGGNHNVELTLDEMPNWFPIDQEVKENLIRANGGKLWKYEWYRKEKETLQFEAVGSAIVATMGSIVAEGYQFRWFKDITTANTGTGTMVYTGGPFGYTPLSIVWNDFSFEMEELE